MLVRVEQNWRWSNKTFPHTLCVVSTSDNTTHCGICLNSNKNLHWVSGGGGEIKREIAFWGRIFSFKIGVLLGDITSFFSLLSFVWLFFVCLCFFLSSPFFAPFFKRERIRKPCVYVGPNRYRMTLVFTPVSHRGDRARILGVGNKKEGFLSVRITCP